MKLVIDFPHHLDHTILGMDQSQATQLLRDALGEFVSARCPVRQYVIERYPDQTPEWRESKIDEVARRVVWASFLKGGTIKLEP
jgi:hypothetical protein